MFVSRAMQVFVTVYREKSLKSAADKLCLTVPPVSRMLKIVEERVGEKLFIIERNRIYPTHAAESLYQQILPHYSALESLKPTSERCFKLSSPHLNTSVVFDLFESTVVKSNNQAMLRQADSIRDDDDIFISFYSMTSPSHFKTEHAELILSLCCASSLIENWQNQVILAEKDIIDQNGFQKALDVLRAHGYKGHYHRIDSSLFLQNSFINGEGLSFKLSDNIPADFFTLPYIYKQPIFIYINKLKMTSLQEKIVNEFTSRINYL